MGFGLKFPVLQLSWSSMLAAGGILAREETRSNEDEDNVGLNIYMADNADDAVPYFDCDFVRPFVLVIGSEAKGISTEVSLG